MKFTYPLAAALMAGTAFASSGEIVSQFTFTGDSYASSDTSSATTTDLVVGADLAADGSTRIEDGTTNLFNINDTRAGNPGEYFLFRYQPLTDDTWFDGTVDALEFTVTPGAGTSLDLTSFTMDLANWSGGSGVQARVYTTAVDGTIDDGTADRVATFTVPGGQGAWPGSPFSVDLTALADVTTTTTFRIEVGGVGNDGRHTNGIDNITLNATVIPEPGSLALLGLGGLLIARRRRG